MRKILLFGDSLTQFSQGPPRTMRAEAGGPGWADRLTEYYSRRADVLNRGCFGYNTRDALATNLVPDLTVTDPDQVLFATVLFGSNDACFQELELNGKHVNLEEYKANLREIITRVSKLTKRVIVFTPPRIREAEYAHFRKEVVHLPVDRSNALLAQYAEACLQVAEEMKVSCLNLFVIADPQIWLRADDGLHFSEHGDEQFFNNLRHLVETDWPELCVKPDDFGQNYSNSGSQSLLAPYLPFYDQLPENGVAVGSTIDGVSVWPSARPSIVLLGDSITQQCQGSPSWCKAQQGGATTAGPGWGDILQACYARRLDVINRGLSGYNSTWTLRNARTLFASFPPAERVELCTLFLGANDATVLPPQHVALEEFTNNMRQLLLLCQTRAKRVLVIGAPPICHTKYLQWRRNRAANGGKREEEILDRTYLLAKQYSDACRAVTVGEEANIAFLDTFTLFGEDFSDCLSDGLHLSARGNRLLGMAVLDVIAREWPEMKCSGDPEYGYYGTQCDAFPPEQPWFQDLHAKNRIKKEEEAMREKKRVKH